MKALCQAFFHIINYISTGYSLLKSTVTGAAEEPSGAVVSITKAKSPDQKSGLYKLLTWK